MTILLTILAIIVLVPASVFGLLAFLRYRRMPKVRRGPLKPLERRLLAALVEHSEPGLAERLSRQIPLFTRYCRLHFDKSMSVDLHADEAGYARLEGSDVAFPNRTDFRLATLSFTLRGETFKAQFGATGGRVFDIVVRPNPRRLLSATDIEVTRYQRGDDAFEAKYRIPQEPYEAVPAFSGFLGEWAQRFGLHDVNRPLEGEVAQRALAQIDATLPPDYLEILRQADGFTVGSWRVLGLAEVHSVPLGAHNYYHIAHDGAFAAYVREGSQDGLVYVCAIEDDMPLAEGTSLRELIEKDLAEV